MAYYQFESYLTYLRTTGSSSCKVKKRFLTAKLHVLVANLKQVAFSPIFTNTFC